MVTCVAKLGYSRLASLILILLATVKHIETASEAAGLFAFPVKRIHLLPFVAGKAVTRNNFRHLAENEDESLFEIGQGRPQPSLVSLSVLFDSKIP